MQILDGRATAKKLLDSVAHDVAAIKEKGGAVKLAVILVGENPASQTYVRGKIKRCKDVGIDYKKYELSAEEATTESIITLVGQLNADPSINGILVQLPLPDHVYAPDVIKAISPEKDSDGFHAYNIGKMFLSAEFEHLAPCTPQGVIYLLNEYNIDLKGKDVCMVGASNIVGKPLGTMLLNREATVTTCHIATKDVAHYTKYADIVIVAVGKPSLITADMVKEGAVIVDVGINRKEDGTLCGDVDFEGVKDKCSYITPVPGGVGPMTIACLLKNTVAAYKRQNDIS